MRPFALACAAGTLSLFATAAQAQVKPGIMERFGPRSERVRAERDRPGRRAAPQAEEAVRGRLLQLIERHDLDKDGKLNGQEAAAAREAWARLRGARVGSKPERGVGGARKGGDGAGKDARNPQARKKQDGVKRPKAGSPLHQALLERFDADGDGRLDGAEATKARAHWARVRKAQGPGGGIDRGNEERVRGDRRRVDPRRADKRVGDPRERGPRARGHGPQRKPAKVRARARARVERSVPAPRARRAPQGRADRR